MRSNSCSLPPKDHTSVGVGITCPPRPHPSFRLRAPEVPWPPKSTKRQRTEAEGWLTAPGRLGWKPTGGDPSARAVGARLAALPASTHHAGQAPHPHPAWGF